ADQRKLTGTLTVDALALDDRLLGRLEVASSYLPGTPDVKLDSLVLRPMDPDEPLPPGMRPDLRVTENRIRMEGTFRLPKSADDDPGALDLRVVAERADGFFFEYIVVDMDHVEGAIVGDGTITGTFEHPIFNADLTLIDGRFLIPKFNLRFQDVEGRVRIDEEGIKTDGVTLHDKTNGTATASGTIFFNDYRFISFDIDARLDDMQIIDVPSFTRELPFYGTIWASGDVTLTGPLDNAVFRAPAAVTSVESEIFIPITATATLVDPGFIIFADSTGEVPDVSRLPRRENILAQRPVGERSFTEGMEIDLNILAPQGSTVHLVIDPLLGDVINAVGSGRIQLQRREGEFSTFGTLHVDSGDYLFTAGEVFVRRFLINEGTITWNGDPLNPSLDIDAAYNTRASRAGLPEDIANRLQPSIPLIVELHITGELNGVQVDLNLEIDRTRPEAITNTQFLETYLNQEDRAAEHASSVLLTNSFLLTTEGTSDVLAGSAFNSVSALVSSQLNRYLSQVIPNADFTFGVQSDEEAQDLDVSAGVAIRLLNERLVIRGEGLYRTVDNVDNTAQQGLQGEFVVEIRLNPSVSVEVFYRREGDVLSESLLTSETGAGLSYQTQFSTWRRLFRSIFGGSKKSDVAADSTETVVVARDG
ncbi:MAG: translocation/assembly module TamB domain-containing protein, partial [Rhodothermales bacterium]